MSGKTQDETVIVVGGTPGGLMTAIAAARRGYSAVVLERYEHIGGLPANGLGATDIATRGATGGLFQAFVDRISNYYVETYGQDSQQAKDCDDGYHFEPSVAERTFEEMVAEYDEIMVKRGRQFDANPDNVDITDGVIERIRVVNRNTGSEETHEGDIFVDATYEGDLAAASGVPFRVGRESIDEYDEPFAGKVYKKTGGDLGPGTTHEGDNAIQSYNYRLCLTTDEENQVSVPKPDGYDREEYTSLIEDIKTNNHTNASDENSPEGLEWILLKTTLPNGKTDMNNHGRSYLSTDLPEENWPWPTSGWYWRDQFADRLRRYTLGLLWFAQNDPELPEQLRNEMSEWGLAADEYIDNDHFPRQVYVREGRRVIGEHFFTAHDARPEVKGARPPIYSSSVTAAHYPIDSHATRKREPGKVHLEGFLSGIYSEPYTVPYGVIVPQKVINLLTPVPVSGTHLGFSTLRMEPCWMALGEAAGTAAALSLDRNEAPGTISTAALQRELLEEGAILMYYEDASPSDTHFEALQFFGVRGFIPGWEANLDGPVNEKTAVNWCNWAGVPTSQGLTNATRGKLLSCLYDHIQDRPQSGLDSIRAPSNTS